MTTGIRATVLLVLILLTGLACSGPPRQDFATDASFYYPIDGDFAWERLRLEDDEILPLEVVNGQLCLLKEQYRRHDRRIEELNYAGVVFNVPSSDLSVLGSHRLQGMSRNSQVIQQVVDIKKALAERPTPIRGMVVLLDSLETITNEQLTHLVKAPASCIMLNNLKYLSTGQAKILAGFKGESICLNGLLWLGGEAAEALAEFGGSYLSLNTVRVLDDISAQALCQYTGKRLYLMELDGVSIDLFNEHRTSRTAPLVTMGE